MYINIVLLCLSMFQLPQWIMLMFVWSHNFWRINIYLVRLATISYR